MTAIRLKGVPTLRVADVPTAKSFYGDFLGFAIDWEHYYAEGAPVYMQVSRDGMVLHLSENPRFVEGVIVFVETIGIAQFHRELSGKDSQWNVPSVAETPWGTHQMEVSDPFGNLLRFNEVVGR